MTIPRLLPVSLVAAPSATAAALSLSHAGYLVDSSDQPVAGNVDMTFALFDAASAGTRVWTSDPGGSSPCAVAVAGGDYAVELGGGCGSGLTSAVLPAGATRWLEVTVGGIALAPRVTIGAAPTAAVASTALEAQGLSTAAGAAGGAC